MATLVAWNLASQKLNAETPQSGSSEYRMQCGIPTTCDQTMWAVALPVQGHRVAVVWSSACSLRHDSGTLKDWNLQFWGAAKSKLVLVIQQEDGQGGWNTIQYNNTTDEDYSLAVNTSNGAISCETSANTIAVGNQNGKIAQWVDFARTTKGGNGTATYTVEVFFNVRVKGIIANQYVDQTYTVCKVEDNQKQYRPFQGWVSHRKDVEP